MVVADAPVTEINSNEWAESLYQWPSPYDRRIMYGGRGASKSHEISQATVIHGHIRPMRICVARERLNSIRDSCKWELEARIRELRLERPDCYRITNTTIEHANGTHIFFIGLSTQSNESIKGLSNVDLVWIDEGHRLSDRSWHLLYPTIRKDDSEVWISFNPEYRYQTAWKLIAENRNNPRWWIKKLTYRDNSYFTQANERDRLDDLANRSTAYYRHQWEGDPDEEGTERKVLPYELLQLCVDAWDRRPSRGAFGTSGFDIADTGGDSNTLAMRFGPELFRIDQWYGSDEFTPVESAEYAARETVAEGIERLDYDAGGVGAPLRGVFRRWIAKHVSKLYANPCQFGGAVQGKDIQFRRARPRSITNAQMFQDWQSQAGFVLRQRAEFTQQLVRGADVDPHRCMYINPAIPNLEDKLSDMSQAEWTDESGKYRIIKRPRKAGEPEPPSPDVFDAVRLAYSYDARFGLKMAA